MIDLSIYPVESLSRRLCDSCGRWKRLAEYLDGGTRCSACLGEQQDSGPRTDIPEPQEPDWQEPEREEPDWQEPEREEPHVDEPERETFDDDAAEAPAEQDAPHTVTVGDGDYVYVFEDDAPEE